MNAIASRLGAIVAASLFAAMVGCGNGNSQGRVQLLNVSFDPTRELWREMNQAFIPEFERASGKQLRIKQSHGGSTSQARTVGDGLAADVVTLALWPDTDAIRADGLISPGWEDRLPERSLPYYSTIVFLVRKGNPKQIRDWHDLAREGVGIITPNPRTSGNGKLAFLAAWGAAKRGGQSAAEAESFIAKVYRNVLVLDTGARSSSVTFSQRKLGDVLLTWENEARLDVVKSKGELEIVYPSMSIKAEPHVAWVDANIDRRGTRDAAEAYLKFLYTDEAQEIFAKHHYRPIKPEALRGHADKFPAIDLFTVRDIAKDWDEIQTELFAEGAVFDRIYSRRD